MSGALLLHRVGPQVTVQDKGRAGFQAQGLSRGGAVDRLALDEAAALLGAPGAALEMAGLGGGFEVTRPARIALTGAPMQVTRDGATLAWHVVHALAPGQRLEIGACRTGSYGYLSIGGGIETPEVLGARSAHLVAGIGAPLVAGAELPLGEDPGGAVEAALPVEDRFSGGTLRVVAGPQTPRFAEVLERFEATAFARDPRANRQGVKMTPPGEGFGTEGALQVVSEVIAPGDIQVTGDGAPYVLLAECQTTGGYPRIGTVIPADMPRAAQAPAGAEVRFRMVTLDEALDAERARRDHAAGLAARVRPLLRDPARMGDLLAHSLISGVTAGDPEAEEHWP